MAKRTFTTGDIRSIIQDFGDNCPVSAIARRFHCHHSVVTRVLEEARKIMTDEQGKREDLARLVVDTWDMETLIEFAVGEIAEGYKKDPDMYANDWEDFGEDDA